MSRARLEYAGKRACYPLLGRPDRTRAVFHVCQWKTGSQWLQAVLSDPRAYRRHRLLPYAYAEFFDFDTRRLRPLPGAGFYGSFFSTHEDVVGALGDVPLHAVVVLREPLKLLISWYVSTRYTHPPTRVVLQRRALLERYDDLDGLVKMAEWFREQADIPVSWYRQRTLPTTFLRFEELVVRKEPAAWAALAEAFGCAGAGADLLRIAGFYDRVVRLRSQRTLFAGGKYAPTVSIDPQAARVVRLGEELRTAFPLLFEAHAAPGTRVRTSEPV